MSSKQWTHDAIQKLTYRELQRLAVENGLKGNAKKVDLIDGLTKLLVIGLQTPRDPPTTITNVSNRNDEQMEVDTKDKEPRPNDTFAIDEHSLADSTHIVETDTATKRKNEEDLYLTYDEPILSGNVELNRTQTLSNHEKENTVQPEEPAAKKPVELVPSGLSRPPRSQLPRPGVNSGRFVESHKRMFEKMESIEQAQEKLKKNREKAMAPNQNINRLATPKQAKPIQRRFRTPSLPNPKKFKLDVLPQEKVETAQKFIPSTDRSSSGAMRHPIIAREPTMDVKTSKQTDTKTIVPRSRLDQLAMSKDKKTVPISKERRSFTPNKSPYRYVDTTKMSNSEFKAYQLQLKQQQGSNRVVI